MGVPPWVPWREPRVQCPQALPGRVHAGCLGWLADAAGRVSPAPCVRGGDTRHTRANAAVPRGFLSVRRLFLDPCGASGDQDREHSRVLSSWWSGVRRGGPACTALARHRGRDRHVGPRGHWWTWGVGTQAVLDPSPRQDWSVLTTDQGAEQVKHYPCPPHGNLASRACPPAFH